jgi:hypothetical protein
MGDPARGLFYSKLTPLNDPGDSPYKPAIHASLYLSLYFHAALEGINSKACSYSEKPG